MKRKVLLVILFLTLTIFLSGCFLFNRLSADVIVEDWKQNYDDNSVKVWFRIHNTGNMMIGCYTIRFTAYCKDGSTYENRYNDCFLPVNCNNSDICNIDIDPNKKVISIKITDWKLEHITIPSQIA